MDETNISSHEKELVRRLRDGIDDNYRFEICIDDDYTLVRFLRARDLSLKDALVMYRAYRKWRCEQNIDELRRIPPPKADLIDNICRMVVHGADKSGHPILYTRFGQIDVTALKTVCSPTEFSRWHAYKNEKLQQSCEEQSRKLGRHISQFLVICDLRGLNLQHIQLMHLFKMISEVDSKYYPEEVRKLLIINAPSVFPIVYRIAKKFIAPKTQAKIELVTQKTKVMKRLLQLIDPSELPIEYGGTSEFCISPKDAKSHHYLFDNKKKDQETTFGKSLFQSMRRRIKSAL